MRTQDTTDPKPYPGFLQSALLCGEYLLATVVIVTPILIAGKLSGSPLEQHPAAESLAVLLATVWVIARYQRRTGAGPDEVAGLFRIPWRIIPPALGFVAGFVALETPLLLWVLVRFPWLDPNHDYGYAQSPAGTFVLLALVAPLTEELVFRGIILRGLAARYPERKALALAAGLFALMHIYPVKFPGTFAMGLCLGWLLLRLGSIWPGVMAHSFNNCFAFVSMMDTEAATPAAALQKLGPWAVPLAAVGAMLTLLSARLLRESVNELAARE